MVWLFYRGLEIPPQELLSEITTRFFDIKCRVSSPGEADFQKQPASARTWSVQMTEWEMSVLLCSDLVLTNLMRLTLVANWLHKQKHKQAHRSRLVRQNQRNLSVKGGIPEISAKPTLCQFFNRSSFTFMCRAHHWVWLPAHTSWDAHTYIHIRVWNNFYVEEKHCLLFFSYTVSPSFLG